MSAKKKCSYCKRRPVTYCSPADFCNICWDRWFKSGCPNFDGKRWVLKIVRFVNSTKNKTRNTRSRPQ